MHLFSTKGLNQNVDFSDNDHQIESTNLSSLPFKLSRLKSKVKSLDSSMDLDPFSKSICFMIKINIP